MAGAANRFTNWSHVIGLFSLIVSWNVAGANCGERPDRSPKENEKSAPVMWITPFTPVLLNPRWDTVGPFSP
jgi:hypothetical protein